MDVQGPRDASLRNIIDKLAEFVARNGPEFEAITKQKQQGNPKFDFLYGGEYANYYQYRVVTEQAYLKQQNNAHQQQMPPGAAMHMQQTQPPPHFGQVVMPPNMLTQQQPPPMQLENAQYNINQPPPSAAQQQHQQHMWPAAVTDVPPTNAMQQQQQNGKGSALTINLTSQIEAINMQQTTLRDQIHQSEANLSAQHTAMMTQQTKQTDEAITAAQNTQMEQQAEEQNISLRDFDNVLQPIIESCTKDSISAGKNWILQHSTDSAKNNVVLQYLLKKALVNGSTFQQKLHLIYLVNDILHHCVRKNVSELKNSLENVVIPMFCSADLIATNEQRDKLTKLLTLWESKAKFFDACVISKLQSPDSSMLEYKTNLQNLHHEIVSKFAQSTKATLDNYQKQHQIFVQHATQQIKQLEQQKQQLEQQMLSQQQQQQQPPSLNHQNQSQQKQQLNSTTGAMKQIPSLMSQKILMPNAADSGELPPGIEPNPFAAAVVNVNNVNDSRNQQNFFIPDMTKPPPGFGGLNAPQLATLMQQQQQQQQYSHMGNSNIPGMMIGNNIIDNSGGGNGGNNTVDLMALNAAIQLVQQQQQQHHLQQQQIYHQQQQHQQLEAQQCQQQQQQQMHQHQSFEHQTELDDEEDSPPAITYTEEDTIPKLPYYDLPAGLMVPLIRLEDYNYQPLDPAEIRLPPPIPQNERLTNALTAFYAPPSHDRPRDKDGWEKLGLYEYYKVKNAARKQKEEEIKDGTREKSRSPSPIIMEKPKPKKASKRSYRSKSRSRSRSVSPYRSPIRSHSRSRSRSRSRGRSEHTSRNSNNNRNNKQRNRSPRHDRESNTNSVGGGRENRAERNNNGSSNNNNNSRRVERDRSPTPPSFFGNNFCKTNEFIEETNKGHQMLMKMGWAGSGTGLGSKSQGIEQPISAGEVRDRTDLYKGVGTNINDPFESFRKNKGAAFVHRMRSRDEKS